MEETVAATFLNNKLQISDKIHKIPDYVSIKD